MFTSIPSNGEAAPTTAEHFAELLVLPQASNILTLAETSYRKLRADRADAWHRLGEEITRMRVAGETRHSPEFVRLAEEHDRLSREVTAARVELDKRRTAFGEKVAADLVAPLAAYRVELERALGDLAELIESGAGLARECSTRSVPMPKLVEAAPVLAARVRALLVTVRG